MVTTTYVNGKTSVPGVNRPNLGSNYDSLLNANPYATTTRKKSWFENLLGSLGFRTAYDRDMDMLAAQANEYYAQIAQQAYAEDFNSPTKQAERERLAGINPDLAGNVGPGEAQTPGQDPSVPDFSVDGGLDSLESFATLIGSGFTLASSIVETGLDIAGKFQSVRSARLKNDGIIEETADELVPTLLPTDLDVLRNDKDPWQIAALERGMARAVGWSKRDRKLLRNALERKLNSPATAKLAFDSARGVLESRKSARLVGGSRFSTDDEEVMDIISTHLQNEIDDAFEQEVKRFKSENKYNQDKFDASSGKLAGASANADNAFNSAFKRNLDPSALASSENAEANFKSRNFRIQYNLKRTMDSIIKDLQEAGDNGNRLAKTLEYVYTLKEFQALPSLMKKGPGALSEFDKGVKDGAKIGLGSLLGSGSASSSFGHSHNLGTDFLDRW